MLLADVLQGPVDQIYALPPDQITPAVAWMGAVFFCLQLYYDFSGYSDMAIGLGRMLGFRFPENFRYPFIARTVAEFWTRWHITLSTWLRDYVFVPLGGYRTGRVHATVNLVITFFLCGLWHGASWNFVLFGLSMGVFISVERWWRFHRRGWFIKTPLPHVYMVLLITMHMVLFRASTVSGAWALMRAMWGFPLGGDAAYAVSDFLNGEVLLAAAVGLVGSLPVIPWVNAKWSRLVDDERRRRVALGAEVLRQSALLLAAGMLAAACSMKLATGAFQPFIYFRF
jgi:alginate O-acetyltransferase complex protein AlgI